ncbi:C1GALT1.2 family protein [Megaselia abdita]
MTVMSFGANYEDRPIIIYNARQQEGIAPTDGGSLSDTLYREVKVLCWVMTNPANHKTKAWSVRQTWGQRCNKLLFMSTESDGDLQPVVLPFSEGREQLWNKTREAFKHVYDHYLEEFDWFLKADDDTYVVMENLRYMLYPYSSEDPIYFGYRFKDYYNEIEQGYMSGGAGYVLSRDALRRFVEEAYPMRNENCSSGDVYKAEDNELGRCLQAVGVKAGDSREGYQERFHPFVPAHHFFDQFRFAPESENWFKNMSWYPHLHGWGCCSNRSITFHYIEPEMMYVYHYFLYFLRPVGVNYNAITVLPQKLPSQTLK